MSRTPQDGKQRALFADDFDGFGPSRFRPADEVAPVFEVRGKRLSKLKRGTRKNAPKRPGVYGMLDSRGRLIYVGKAKNLRARLLCYFRENSRDPKAGKIIDQTKRLVWEECGDELAALLRELELIQRVRPKYNVLGVPGLQRHHYLCVGKTPAAFVYVTARPAGGEQGVYGPFVRRTQSEEGARRLNDLFKLRDCPQSVPLRFAEQGELFDPDRGAKCLRFDLGTCAGPCVGACSRQEYAVGVRAVKAFLDGRNRTVLGDLREQMQAAAAEFQFERATSLATSFRRWSGSTTACNCLRAGARPQLVRVPAARGGRADPLVPDPPRRGAGGDVPAGRRLGRAGGGPADRHLHRPPGAGGAVGRGRGQRAPGVGVVPQARRRARQPAHPGEGRSRVRGRVTAPSSLGPRPPRPR
jgi:excinuclease ABC subunit C